MDIYKINLKNTHLINDFFSIENEINNSKIKNNNLEILKILRNRAENDLIILNNIISFMENNNEENISIEPITYCNLGLNVPKSLKNNIENISGLSLISNNSKFINHDNDEQVSYDETKQIIESNGFNIDADENETLTKISKLNIVSINETNEEFNNEEFNETDLISW